MRLRALSRLVLSIVLLLFLSATSSHAADKNSACATVFKDVPLKSTQATAGFFANFRRKPESVSVQSEEIFREAESSAKTVAPPKDLCPAGCRLSPYMHFRSVPQKFLEQYDDAEHCAALEKETSVTPITFSNSNIRSVEDMTAWIGELTQGKGKEGKELYRRCDKSCSPRYEYRIHRIKPGEPVFAVQVDIVCGAARDKDNDMYNLTSFFRFSCE